MWSASPPQQAWLDEVYGQHITSLDRAGVEAIGRYGGTAYKDLNRRLRAYEDLLGEQATIVNALDAAIDLAPRLPETVRVWRGASSRQVAGLIDDGRAVGAELSDGAYLSASLLETRGRYYAAGEDPRIAFLAELVVPAGARGLGVGGYPADVELLLPRGARLVVVDAYTEADGFRHLVARLDDT